MAAAAEMEQTQLRRVDAAEYGAFPNEQTRTSAHANVEDCDHRSRRQRRFALALLLGVLVLGCIAAAGIRGGALSGAMAFAAGSPYSPDILLRQVWFATAAYCNVADIEGAWHGPAENFTTTRVIIEPHDDLMAFVGIHKAQKYIQVSFRGTESANNWAVDLMALPLDSRYPDCAECMVHGGFWAAERVLIDPVLSEIQRLQKENPTFDVYVTGHSLGGALAVLAALDIVETGIPVRCYTFGMPRVGNRAWADYLRRALPVAVRVTHNRDAVPHMPPTSFGFRHSAPEVFEAADGGLTLCEEDGESPACSARFALWQTNV